MLPKITQVAAIAAALSLTSTATAAAGTLSVNFYTSGSAAACLLEGGGEALRCYTPNDGFGIYMYSTGRVPRTGDYNEATGTRITNPFYQRDLRGDRTTTSATRPSWNTATAGCTPLVCPRLRGERTSTTHVRAAKPDSRAPTSPATDGGSADTRAIASSSPISPQTERTGAQSGAHWPQSRMVELGSGRLQDR
jgi:hypothetical protein